MSVAGAIVIAVWGGTVVFAIGYVQGRAAQQKWERQLREWEEP